MLEESETPESEAPETQPAHDDAAVAASASTRSDAEVSADSEPEVVIDLEAGDTPSVDELQGRLAELQGAMDQLQSGDLDGAEATIASLEQAMASASKSAANTPTP